MQPNVVLSAPIDLDRKMKPLSRMFGGSGEVLTYRKLESESVLWPSGPAGCRLEWRARGNGFGQAWLSDECADTEILSRSFVAALFNRYIDDAAWSNEGYTEDIEVFSDLQVLLDNTETQVGFSYQCSAGAGVVYLAKETRNFGEVNFVDIEASPLKSREAVKAIVFAWLNQIAEWR